MLLDTSTMYLLLCIGNFILFVLLVIFAKFTQTDGLFIRYSYSKLFQSLGILLMYFRDALPESISVIIINGLLLVGVTLEAFCLIYIGKIPSYRAAKSWIRISVFLVAGYTLLYLAGVSTAARASVLAAIIAIIALVIAVNLIFNTGTKIRQIFGAFFLCFSFLYFIRAKEAVAGTGYMLFGLTIGQSLAFLLAYSYMLFSTMAFLMMSREAMDIKLKQAATMDYLTGVYNRMQFMNLAQKKCSLLARQKKPVSILMLDLDHFKAINDKYGHFTGDEVLIHFSRNTAEVLRNGDIFGRYGGEEFIVFLPNTDRQEALLVGQKIKTHLATVAALQTIPNYTVSIGAATIIPACSSDIVNVMQMADEALFQAKRSGRNRVIQFDAGFN